VSGKKLLNNKKSGPRREILPGKLLVRRPNEGGKKEESQAPKGKGGRRRLSCARDVRLARTAPGERLDFPFLTEPEREKNKNGEEQRTSASRKRGDISINVM